MREWINLIESKLFFYPEDDHHAIGYWYNPRTRQSYIIAWDQADNVNHFSDHGDIVADHPDWFGIPSDYEFGDLDEARNLAVLNGWVKIGYSSDYSNGSGMWLMANSPLHARKALSWFFNQHEVPLTVSLDILTTDALSSYVIRSRDEIEAFAEKGRLQPAWKIG